VISLRGLRFSYARGPAFAFADVDVPQGGVLLVRGPSGSGKSTMLALLAGLLSPSAGHVCVDSTDVAALPAGRRDAWRGRTLGFMPQRLHLSDNLSVTGNLELPFVCSGQAVDAAAVQDVLSLLHIGDLGRRRPHELSLGQAQRVALARAVVRRPAVLVADEPTANLDDANAHAVVSLLRELSAQSQATLVLATHDPRVASQVAASAILSLEVPA
jgi:putative ABC transport system ATP-binding protein